MTFDELIGATVVEADSAGIQLRLPDGRVAEVFATTEDYPSQKNVPTLFVYDVQMEAAREDSRGLHDGLGA